jgi:hypothetical protein
MRWTVLWKASAEGQLARLWLKADERQAVRAAADALDGELSNDPLSLGESRSGHLRVAFAAPIGIEFEAVPDDRVVYVLAVWRFRAQ